MKRIDDTKAILEQAMVDIRNGQTVEELNAIMEKCIVDATSLWPQDEVDE